MKKVWLLTPVDYLWSVQSLKPKYYENIKAL